MSFLSLKRARSKGASYHHPGSFASVAGIGIFATLASLFVFSVLIGMAETSILYGADVSSQMRKIPAGQFQGFILEAPGRGKTPAPLNISVPSFDLDALPVSNAEFLEFVRANPKWQRSVVLPVFADSSYLNAWKQDLDFGGAQMALAPVTSVSWFAARSYCRWAGKRLPLLNEWEYAARPEAFGKDREKVLEQILQWYSTPNSKVLKAPDLKSDRCTVDGICGLHGLVWEWVEDFGSVIASSENRSNDTPDGALFCGAGALGAFDAVNYAAFMRYAFRTSLKGDYTIGNLGFRCAKDSK